MTDTLWPDFDRYEFLRALLSFQERNRRFGAVWLCQPIPIAKNSRMSFSGQPMCEGVADAQPDDESHGPVTGAENRDAAAESRNGDAAAQEEGHDAAAQSHGYEATNFGKAQSAYEHVVQTAVAKKTPRRHSRMAKRPISSSIRPTCRCDSARASCTWCFR